MTKDAVEWAEFLRWKAEQDERVRKRGAYWLTPEGRAELREVFDDHDDGNSVRPLLDALERAESTIADYRRSGGTAGDATPEESSTRQVKAPVSGS